MPMLSSLILAGLIAVASPEAPDLGFGADPGPRQGLQDLLESPDGQLSEDEDSGGSKVELTDTEIFSALAGNILGAATLCKEIDKDRVTQATDHVASLVAATSSDEQEQNLSKLLFMHNLGGGRAAVRTGEVDCGTVATSLTQLEQFAERAAGTNTGGSE